MATTYELVRARVGTQLNVQAGATSTEADYNYSLSATTNAVYFDPRFTKSVIADAILDTEAQLIEAICYTGSNPERAAFVELTASVASGASIPLVGASGAKIIGALGAVIDATSSIVCSPRELSVVRMRANNENSMFQAAAYIYALDGSKIYHSRTNVKIDVATFTRGTFTGNIKVQDHQVGALVDGALGMLFAKEEAYITAAQYHNGRFAAYIQMIMGVQPIAQPVAGN